MSPGDYRRPKKSLGQNFLVDKGTISRIVAAASPGPGQTVVEIGPGRGALTASLRAVAERFVAVEKDDDLAPRIAELLADDESAALLHRDALTLGQDELPFPGPYNVVANLPYNIAGRITMHLLEDWPDARRMTLMYQREVADRLAASPGHGSYGALSVLVQSFCEAWVLFPVPPGAFRPVPKVRSAVVRLQRRDEPLHAGLPYPRWNKLVHGIFRSRRKTVLNALNLARPVDGGPDAQRAVLDELGIDPGLRADALSVADYVRLGHRLLAEA